MKAYRVWYVPDPEEEYMEVVAEDQPEGVAV